MRASAFIATSLDGFIARTDGSLDWLPGADGAPSGDDHGYGAFIADVDALVMGRNTFDTVLAMRAWPYDERDVVVLSHRPLPDVSDIPSRVERHAGPVEEALGALAARGRRHAYVDGGRTIRQCLRAGLLCRLTITWIPVLLGQGIPLFGDLPADVRLRHVHTVAYDDGLVQSTYARAP